MARRRSIVTAVGMMVAGDDSVWATGAVELARRVAADPENASLWRELRSWLERVPRKVDLDSELTRLMAGDA